MDMTCLNKTIAEIVATCSNESVSSLSTLLASCPSDQIPSLNTVTSLSQEFQHNLIHRFLAAWKTSQGKVSGVALSLALDAAKTAYEQALKKCPHTELVWTGPHPPNGGPVRNTVSVLSEMIRDARQHILLVGYSLSAKSQSAINIINALSGAKFRGCSVTVALHNDGYNHNLFTELWPATIPLPKILHWADPDDTMTSLHAKLIAVDGNDLLVTSANLSFHGLDRNIEVGLRISGPYANTVTRHFAALERENILVPL